MSDLVRILQDLPQAPVIKQEHAERWLAGVTRYHSARAIWHAKRLSGIGGSEIGAVLRGIKDLKESGFSTFRRVVESKLMMRLPEFETSHMRRGTALEPLARLAFLYRYKAQRDVSAMDATAEAKPRSGYEWLVGNPDDIVLIGGKRFVTDYKVPNQFDDVIEYDYRAQLHHYALLSRMANVKIDGLILAKLDLSAEFASALVERTPTMTAEELHDIAKTIARIDMPGMRVVGLGVDLDREMQVDILDAGATTWNQYVNLGVVPPKPNSQLLELNDSQLLNIANLQQQYAMAKSGITYLSEQCSEIEKTISESLDGVDIEDKAMPLSLVKISRRSISKDEVIAEAIANGARPDEIADKPGYSVVALIEEIKRLNGDAVAPHLYAEPVPNADKAKAYLTSIGINPADLQGNGVGLRMSAAKTDKEIGKIFQRSASDRFGSWLDESRLADIGVEDELEAITDFDLEAVSGPLHQVFASDDVADTNTNPSARNVLSASMR